FYNWSFPKYPGPIALCNSPEFLLAEAAFFCDAIASRVASSISTDQLLEVLA
ncbi:unnamed protein product, partial [marine sediment metagenome]